jgi:hypothetical protein
MFRVDANAATKIPDIQRRVPKITIEGQLILLINDIIHVVSRFLFESFEIQHHPDSRLTQV